VADGAVVIVARSGTACRAPTEETATAKGTMPRRAPSIGDLRCCVTLAQA